MTIEVIEAYKTATQALIRLEGHEILCLERHNQIAKKIEELGVHLCHRLNELQNAGGERYSDMVNRITKVETHILTTTVASKTAWKIIAAVGGVGAAIGGLILEGVRVFLGS